MNWDLSVLYKSFEDPALEKDLTALPELCARLNKLLADQVPALACLCEGGRLSCPRWLASLPHRFLKSCGIFIRLFTNHLIGRYHPCPVETGRKGSAVSE